MADTKVAKKENPNLVHKSDLVEQIAQTLNYPKTKTLEIVDQVFEAIQKNLSEGKEVSIKGFGKWSLSKRKAKKGHRAPNGKIIDIPEYVQTRFKSGRQLKTTVKAG